MSVMEYLYEITKFSAALLLFAGGVFFLLLVLAGFAKLLGKITDHDKD